MVRRTTIEIDDELLLRAKRALGSGFGQLGRLE